MVEQSKWSSSRVAHHRAAQLPPSQPAGATNTGSQQSRWASASSSTVPSSSSGNPDASTSSASSWRSRQADSNHAAGRALSGSAESRWACPVKQDAPVSTLEEAFHTMSISTFKAHAPPRQPHSSLRTPSDSISRWSTAKSDVLRARDPSRPVGGKSLDRLALLASPSRGLDSSSTLATELSSQGSMDLTTSAVQVELREYISTRITTKALPLLSCTDRTALNVLDSARYLPGSQSTSGKGTGAGEEELQQILLLVRKLREALVASKRIDRFAVEVYELSAYLSILCGDVPQLVATLPRLVLDLYPDTASSQSEAGQHPVSDDVQKLASQLGLHTVEGQREKRLRMISLYLLQTMCLSGRATRLGQYSAADAGQGLASLRQGLREYQTLRASLSKLYGEELQLHLQFCDGVYAALRDINPFHLSTMLQQSDGSLDSEEYRVDAWQRLLLLQAAPSVRGAVWNVVRKAYMYLPISRRLERLISPPNVPSQQASQEARPPQEAYLVKVLLLGRKILPCTNDGVKEKGKRRFEQTATSEETPDDWDAEEPSPQPRQSANAHLDDDSEEENERLYTFLFDHFGSSLGDRLTSIKEGVALRLK